ncbi:MAG TPA: hypothetical protein VK422_02505 [Pyrinomonadaceae bacterium]|nr:hypothetical protein [Pyrinomonadaceae bacterium]
MKDLPDIPARRAPDTLEHKRWYKALVAVLCVLMAAASALLAWELVNWYRQQGAYRVEYEGLVVDKSLTLQETQTGTGAMRRLLIRARGGEEFQVVVNEVLYERARVGMWISSDRGGARLYDSPPPPAAPSKAEGAEHPSASAPEPQRGPGPR